MAKIIQTNIEKLWQLVNFKLQIQEDVSPGDLLVLALGSLFLPEPIGPVAPVGASASEVASRNRSITSAGTRSSSGPGTLPFSTPELGCSGKWVELTKT